MEYNGRRYAASTNYIKSAPIDNFEQGSGTLFGDEETEIIVTFTDRPDTQDYYVIDFGFSEFLAVEDEFVDGQAFEFSYFYDQEFEPGTELTVNILGADQNFFKKQTPLKASQNSNMSTRAPKGRFRDQF